MSRTPPDIIEKMIAFKKDGYSSRKIAAALGLAKETVRRHLALAGHRLPPQPDKFSKIGKKGIDYLKANFQKISCEEMAAHLQVHVSYLRACLRLHNLLTPRMQSRMVWNAKADALLKKHYGSMKMMDLTKLLGTHRKAIYDRARILGIVNTRYGIDKNPVAKRAPRKVAAPEPKQPETPKRVEKTYSTIANPTAGKVPVKLNHKTVVYLPSNYTPEMLQAAKSRLNIF
jgi:transposase